MDQVMLSASPRSATGNKIKALRRAGQVPLHLYGLKADPLSLQASLDDVRGVLRDAGFTAPVRIKVEAGEEAVTLVRDVSRHPVTGALQHVDLLRVDPEKPIEVPVPVVMEYASIAPGTRGGAGVVTQGLYEVMVRAKPFDAPRQLIADCRKLDKFDSVIKVSDLTYPPGAEPAWQPEAHVAWIQAPRVTKVAEVAPTAVEGAPAAAEGTAPAAGAAATAGGAKGAPAAGAKGAAPAAGGAKGAPAAGAKGAAPAAGGAKGAPAAGAKPAPANKG